MKGFFATGEISKDTKGLPVLKPRCTDCGLYKGCINPYVPVSGEGRRGVLVVDDAPGKTEDEKNAHFMGEAGQYLRRALRLHGVDLDRDCWKTHAVVCRPPASRTPDTNEVDYCRPNLLDTLQRLKPAVIIPLGHIATRSVVAPQHADVSQTLRWVGQQIPDQRLNAWVCPTWHPSYMSKGRDNDVMALWFGRHLAGAFALQGVPWPDGPPNYARGVERMLDPVAAAAALDRIPRDNAFMVFDYECDRLKPDAAASRLVCASVAWGYDAEPRQVFAFPWLGEAIPAMGRLLRAPIYKCAHNIQMEDRWTRAKFGYPPRNWRWCTQQAAHVADNRESTTSLDFQAYIHFGQPDWDTTTAAYLRSGGTAIISRSNAPNQIRDVPLARLLLYCGIDSAISYRLAWFQAAKFGVRLLKEVCDVGAFASS